MKIEDEEEHDVAATEGPAARPPSWAPYLVAAGLALTVAPVCAWVTLDAVVPPYPPADWAAQVVSGTVIRREQEAGRGGKPTWAVVATPEGERRMPMEVHDQVPREGARVVKRAGEESFDVEWAPGDWSTATPAAEPGEGLGTGLLLCGGWFVALASAACAVVALLRRRRGVSPGSS